MEGWINCTSPITFNNLSEGNHNFRVRTTDEAGNLGDFVQWNWTVDTEAPVISQIHIEPQIVYYNISVINLTAMGYDYIGHVESRQWELENETVLSSTKNAGGNWLDVNLTLRPGVDPHPGFVLPKGNYTVTLRLKDNSGQWSNEIVSWVDVRDGTPLAYIASLESNIFNFGSSVNMSGHGEDVDGFINEYQWESSRDGIISNTPNFSTDDLSPGYHTISFRVKDNDDQWSEDNVTIRINSYPEIVDVNWLQSEVYRYNETTLIGSVFDDYSSLSDMNVTLEYRNLSNNQWTLINSTFVLTDENKFEVNFSSDFTFESTFYDFRVTVVDLDSAASTFYYNQSLKLTTVYLK